MSATLGSGGVRFGEPMSPGKDIRTRGRARLAGVAVLTVCGALAAPAAASAAETSAQVSGSTLRVTGLAGISAVQVSYHQVEANDVGPSIVLSDEGGVDSAGDACVAVNPQTVSCDARAVNRIVARLGDGDDVMAITSNGAEAVPASIPAFLHGEGGADVIAGGRADDRVFGEQGRDTVAGGAGDDAIHGGERSDAVIGFGGDDSLFGEEGRDALFGQKGHDSMRGGTENDVLLARDGERDPKLLCGQGRRQQAITDRFDPSARSCTTPAQRKAAERKRKRQQGT